MIIEWPRINMEGWDSHVRQLLSTMGDIGKATHQRMIKEGAEVLIADLDEEGKDAVESLVSEAEKAKQKAGLCRSIL